MALKKYKLGELIELLENNNTSLLYGEDDVRGVNNVKQLMPTKADISNRDLKKFQIVDVGNFVFNHRTSRNGDKFSIAYNEGEKPVICTEDYVVFRVKKQCEKIINATWLYLFFNRSEFDRYVITNSWGSSTEFYNWEDLCSVEFNVPDLEVQEKYVKIYKAMVANQKAYEKGLSDLKLVCDGFFDQQKHSNLEKLGNIIEIVDVRNKNGIYKGNEVKGINNNKEFVETKADIANADLSKFKIVDNGYFAYNSRTDGRNMLVLALNRFDKPIIVTFNYNVFRIIDDRRVNADYLYAYMKRGEFDRLVRFNSWGSSQELLSWKNLCDIEIPIPDIKVQKSIADIYKVYIERKEINEKLKAQIKDLCPILIKGSLEEGK